MFCAGGVDKENPLNPKDNRENGVMVFFRDSLGPILNKAWFKAIIILVFLAYLGKNFKKCQCYQLGQVFSSQIWT